MSNRIREDGCQSRGQNYAHHTRHRHHADREDLGVSLTNRRYVIDETVGAVSVFLTFESLPDSHEFRLEGGKLRYVHTLTVMG
jgi:hypothetical protein